MIINKQLIDIFFRLLNFGIFIGLCVYVFKKYLQKKIKTDIQNEKLLITGLNQENSAVDRLYKECEKSVDDDEQNYKVLQGHVNKWVSDLKQQENIKLCEKNNIVAELKKRAKEKEDSLHSQHIVRLVMPKVVDNASGVLKSRFSNDEKGTQFVSGIIKYLKKSQS